MQKITANSIHSVLERAWSIHQDGKAAEAMDLYRKVLQSSPGHNQARYLLGVAFNQLGRKAEAEKEFQCVLQKNPGFLPALVDMGLLLVHQNRCQEALPVFRRALSLNSDLIEIWFEVALIHQEAGNLSEAVTCYAEALRRCPHMVEAWNNMGAALEGLNKFEKSIEAFKESIRQRPDLPGGWIGLGRIHQNLGQNGDAEKFFRKAAAACPASSPAPFLHLANLYYMTHRIREAEDQYRKVLVLSPDHTLALNNLGSLLVQEGRPAEAAEYLKRALEKREDYADASANLGAAQKAMGHFEEAKESLRNALALMPDHAFACRLLGKILGEQGEFASGRELLGRACKSRPEKVLWELERIGFAPAIPESRDSIDKFRSEMAGVLSAMPGIDLDQFKVELNSCDPRPSLLLCYQGGCNLPLRKSYSELFQATPVGRRLPREKGPWRIGFVVTAGHEGIFLRCCKGILESLNHPLLEISVVAPASGIGKIRGKIERDDLNFLPLSGDLPAIISDLQRADFDLLYYWEIGSDSENYFLPFFRPAPVQCTSWGTPESTGIAAVDFYLSWEGWETERAESHYSEILCRLQTPPVCYSRPIFDPSGFKPRERFGLDSGRPFFFCPQNLLKVHPDFDQILFSILEKDPAVQICFVEGHHGDWSRLLQERWKRYGILAERIQFLPRMTFEDYMNVASLANAILDTVHFSGGNTSYELFAIPAPIVTLPGNLARSRFTSGCYRKMEVMDLVAEDDSDYVSKVLRLGRDVQWRREIIRKIGAANSALYDDKEAVRQIEGTFLRFLGGVYG